MELSEAIKTFDRTMEIRQKYIQAKETLELYLATLPRWGCSCHCSEEQLDEMENQGYDQTRYDPDEEDSDPFDAYCQVCGGFTEW